MPGFKDAFRLLKDTYNEWDNDNASSYGAALAYYTVFSLPSLLLIIISIAAYIFGEQASKGQLANEFQSFLGKNGAEMVQTMIQNTNRHGEGVLAGIIGAISLIFSASGVFLQLQLSLNTMWGVKSNPRGGIWGFIFKRLISFGMIFFIGFVLIASLVLTGLIASFGRSLAARIIGSVWAVYAAYLADLIIDVAIITFLFGIIYRFLPDVKTRWRDIWFGAVSTAALFTVGQYLIGIYLGKSSVTSPYGAAGTLVLILVWIYYSSQIIFFGAELTKVYANRFGEQMQPARHAVLIQKK